MIAIPQKIPDSKWFKAAVVASYWAAFEIIVGSFLHNLRFPLSGTILSFISVFLLVSFISRWKQNGIIWRAGLICALMKSISPSAMIIGPMIGIFSEALLMEFFIWVFGKNLLGYMIGGAFAVLSALLHKLVSLLIMYGIDLVKILGALYSFIVKQIGLENLDARVLVLVITLIYLVTGMVAAIAGYFTAKRPELRTNESKPGEQIILENDQGPVFKENIQRYSVWLLGLNLSSIILLLALINIEQYFLSVTLSAFYLAFIISRYKNVLRHLKKISFWIYFVLITLIAAMLLNGISKGSFYSVEGLWIGLKMNFRAVIILMGFSAISVELKNPIIRTVSYKRGMAELYQSVGLAFSALPSAIGSFPGTRTFFRNPVVSIRQLLVHSEALTVVFEKAILQRPDIIIITGERQAGKTTFVTKVVTLLSLDQIKVCGFLAIGFPGDSRRIGFNLLDISTNQQTELCRDQSNGKGSTFERFTFSQKGLDAGERILLPENVIDARLVVIDEIGPVEMKNEGWAGSIRRLVNSSRVCQLWVVRKSLVSKVAATWPVGNVYVFDIIEDRPEDTAIFIEKLLDSKISSTERPVNF